ncbi:sensor histidine kinase [Roseivirga sp.]|uniref:sensor histidine kinase n=1 Tax=Roseivirga sp. TaxID=1964215 RepID=UPI003B8BA721
MNKSKLYWLLQFGGWGGLMLTSFLVMVLLLPTLPALVINTVIIFLAVFVSHRYRVYVKKRNWKDLKVPDLVPKVLIASVVQGIALSVLIIILVFGVLVLLAVSDPTLLDSLLSVPQIEGLDESTQEVIRDATLSSYSGSRMVVFAISFVISNTIYFISWSAIYFAYQFIQKAREMEIEKWKLSASVKDAELSTLKAQINPHFIFNSLNNIRSLVVEDAERARDSITHLSDLLRFSIQFDQYEKVSLEKELEVVEDYLNLEAIQLEERLKYNFIIDENAKEVLIPPMIIQTLVENAIKHSINNLPNGGEIIISTRIDEESLSIYVKNTGQLSIKASVEGKKKHKGIGISNSRERLRLLYGQEARLAVENMNEQMVCATVKIPFK